MSDQNCPICSSIVKDSGRGGSADFHDYKCPVCGPFTITRTALHNLRSERLTEKKSVKGDVGSKTTYEIRNRVNMVQYKMSLFA